MKQCIVLGVSALSIWLASCTAAEVQPVRPVLGEATEPTSVSEVTTAPSTNTPQLTEELEKATNLIEQSVEPTDEQIQEATLIPCPGVLTSPNQEGPFYKPGSPQKTSLIEEGMAGIPILIFGRVFDQDCSPLPEAKLDFWLADVNGEYDNAGYRLRGHVFSDQDGNYMLESIEPTEYTGRPEHIHVKIFSPDGRELLTTQMYMSGSEGSADVTAAPDLLATYLDVDEAGRRQVLFNFVVQN